jgi:phenylacetate-CoA ligase
MGPFAGRGDNMVKLRGINVWPEALGELAMAIPGVAPDYFVRVRRENNRDEMTLSVVSESDPAEYARIGTAVADRLKDKLGVKIDVEVVRPGALDEWTGVNKSAKLKRFRDDR